jgi:hypothetical protein
MVIFRGSQPELYQRVDFIDAKVDGIDKLITAHMARYEEQIRGIQNQLREQNEIGKAQHAENQKANRWILGTMFFLAAASKIIPGEAIDNILRILMHGG